jgi:hypothetical protein
MSCQDITEAPPPPQTTFGELMKRMQDADPDAPLDPPMEMRCKDDEFNYLVNQIDEYTGYFMRLQKTMTTTLDR